MAERGNMQTCFAVKLIKGLLWGHEQPPRPEQEIGPAAKLCVWYLVPRGT